MSQRVYGHAPYPNRPERAIRAAERRQRERQNPSRPQHLMNDNYQFVPINGWAPLNKRNYSRLAKISSDQNTCYLNLGTDFSQFQVYCYTSEEDALTFLPNMKWPILVRFFDNFKIPGYAILVQQKSSNDRYYGEAYWIGWTIPYWMSLPVSLLSDDDKRKLTLYWIARQRREHDLFRFSKLSILLTTYFPNAKQLEMRRIDEEEPEVYAFQSAHNPPGTPTPAELLRNPDNQPFMVYCINGGKGADLSRNKNVALSLLVKPPVDTGQPDNSLDSDDWLKERELDSGPHEPTVWENLYTLNHQEKPVNNLENLDTWLDDHESHVLGIVNRFSEKLDELLNAPDIQSLRSYFTLSENKEDDFDNAFNELMQTRDELIQRYNGDTRQIAHREAERLMIAILHDYVPQVISRWNSNPVKVANSDS